MGANGIVDMAAKVYGAKVAGKVATAMATEGITEGAQEYTFLRTEAYGGAEQDASTYADRLKEATIGGAFAGGTIRSGASLSSFDADINSDDVRVRGTPITDSSTVFKLTKTLTRVRKLLKNSYKNNPRCLGVILKHLVRLQMILGRLLVLIKSCFPLI